MITVYPLFFAGAMKSLDRLPFVNGSYYIPLESMNVVVRSIVRNNVPRNCLVHLSGDWFGRSYEYLHRELYRARPRSRNRVNTWAIIEDLWLRAHQTKRTAFLEKRALERHEPVCIIYCQGDREAEEIQRKFWDLEEE
jgi:hypothetical protein